jgi:hypothetical protein
MISAISDSYAAGESFSLNDNIWLTFHRQSQILGMVSVRLKEPKPASPLNNYGQVAFRAPDQRIRKNALGPAELLNETPGPTV